MRPLVACAGHGTLLTFAVTLRTPAAHVTDARRDAPYGSVRHAQRDARARCPGAAALGGHRGRFGGCAADRGQAGRLPEEARLQRARHARQSALHGDRRRAVLAERGRPARGARRGPGAARRGGGASRRCASWRSSARPRRSCWPAASPRSTRPAPQRQAAAARGGRRHAAARAEHDRHGQRRGPHGAVGQRRAGARRPARRVRWRSSRRAAACSARCCRAARRAGSAFRG